jgi:spermidine/putrescine transport system ATP-binding protein
MAEPAAAGAPLLVLERLERRFGAVAAVAGIDLEIQAGEFVAIMGPSGCGKSTTLRMIAGLDRPTAGEIRLRGRRLNEASPWQRDTPMVWQSLALFPFLSVRHNVEFGLKMRGVAAAERRRRALAWLERLGIGELADRRIDQVSGGQRQRVALARSLVIEPEILLLDEPLSALDANLAVRMQAELVQLQKQLGITFCYVTHNQSEAFAMADRVVIMNQGRIEQIGPPREVYRAPRTRFVAEFIGANNILAGEALGWRDGLLTIGTAHGQFAVATPEPRPERGPSVIVVAADRIALGPPGSGSGNRLTGRLVGEEFVGAVVTLHLDVGQGTILKIQKQQHEVDSLELGRGAAIEATWRPEHGYLLPLGTEPGGAAA